MGDLSEVHRYAAGALFALALNQAQIHRQSIIPQVVAPEQDGPVDAPTLSEEEEAIPWSSESCGLLRHIFRYLEIDQQAWSGIEAIASSVDAKHHIGAFIRVLHEDAKSPSPATAKKKPAADPAAVESEKNSVAALAKAVDAMSLSLEEFAEADPSAKGKTFEETFMARANEQKQQQQHANSSSGGSAQATGRTEAAVHSGDEDKDAFARQILIKQRKVAIVYGVLTACVADSPEEKAGKSALRAGYDARQRAALRLLAVWLDIEWEKLAAIELTVAYMAMATAKKQAAEKAARPEEEEKQGWAKWKRGGIIGAAAVTSGALLAVTGGLAAPAIAAGISAIAPTALGVGGLATAMGSAAGSVAVGASFGAAGAGLAGTKMARRTGGVEEFMFLPIGHNHQQGRLAVGIMAAGVVFEAEDFLKPWEGPDWDLERYALRWESKELIAVSTAIEDWLKSSAYRELIKRGAMYTVLSGLVSALAWPVTLLSFTDWIDGKWSIAVDRSDKAGVILASHLLQGTQGNRPVTLIGYSLGARVIFSCLEHLAKNGDTGSIVERVVLLGAPITLDQERWKNVRKVVAGRFVNAYSTNDWILGVIYRASFLTQGLAGLQNVKLPGIENIDVTDVVGGHSQYLAKANEILSSLDIDSFYPVYPSKLKGSKPKAA